MNGFQKMKLIQEEHDAMQKSWGSNDGFRGNQHKKVVSGENLHLPSEIHCDTSKTPTEPKENKKLKTREVIAAEHHIPEGAVKFAVAFGRGLDKAAEVDPQFVREESTREYQS